MTTLGVNIDHIATLRQARRTFEPDPLAAALLAELAGAHGITVHLRSDRRHIQDADIHRLRDGIATRLNIEMAATQEMIDIALDVRPDTVTLVPERPDEITTEGGLDLISQEKPAAHAIDRLEQAGIEVSLFIDPEPEQIRRASALGSRLIELNTNAYATVVPKGLKETDPDFNRELNVIRAAAELADSLGLIVLAGHGLTYRNVRPVSAVPQIRELNIGHNIVARAALVGMERAVREMLAAMNSG